MPLRLRSLAPRGAGGQPRLEPLPGGRAAPSEALALPGEHALLLRMPLPLPTHRQRQAAVGFAVEDLLAEPLESTHVVVGPELGPGEYLAVAVAHREMAPWAARTAPGQRLTVDVLTLPVPADGLCSVREIEGRVLVRRADGTGYAAPADTFEQFWRADGSLGVVLYGGRLPDGVPVSASGLAAAAPADVARFDLLQGPYAPTGGRLRRLAIQLALIAAVTIAAHVAILTLDVAALRRIADAREAVLRAELSERGAEGLPLDVALRQAIPQAPGPRSGFLPLLARVAEVLAPFADRIAFRQLSYDAADGGLALTVEAPDLATLQQVEAELRAATLAVSAGVATTGDGGAEIRYVVQAARV